MGGLELKVSSKLGAVMFIFVFVKTGEWENIDRVIAVPMWLASLEARIEPELSARRTLDATEIIFAIYESCRRRGLVDLPLNIGDNPLVAMVESGNLQLKS